MVVSAYDVEVAIVRSRRQRVDLRRNVVSFFVSFSPPISKIRGLIIKHMRIKMAFLLDGQAAAHMTSSLLRT